MKLQMKEHNQPGLLFTFCGLDGSGKTTQIELLSEYLKDNGFPVFLTKQPTDFVRKSDMFRTYMDQPDHDEYEYRALSLLCASDRVQHTYKVILPELAGGSIVLSDRYFYSCLTNLRARNYVQDHWIYDVASFIPKPDCAFFLDIPVKTAISRVRSRPHEKTRFIDVELQYRLREEFLRIAEDCGGIILDGSKDPIEIHSFIIELINEGRVLCKG